MTELSAGKLYHETAFRHLLNNEASRSQRSGLAYHVLLFSRDTADGKRMPLDAKVAVSVTKVLKKCLRDTDYIGWYRDGRVMGGVLTAMGKEFGADHIEDLTSRIVDMLCSELGEKEVEDFQIDIFSADKWAAGADQ